MTIRLQDYDGRYDRSIKSWAGGVEPFPNAPGSTVDSKERERYLQINAHPAILNEAAKYIKGIEPQKTKLLKSEVCR